MKKQRKRYTAEEKVVFVAHCQRGNRVRIISARRGPEESAGNMKQASAELDDDLRPEYDLSQLKGGVRGKYYRQAVAGTMLMLIELEVAEVFRDSESVNGALRLPVDTAERAAGPARRRDGVPNKRTRRQPARQEPARG